MKPKWKWICFVPAVLLVIWIAGCALTSQPYTYHDDRDEKPGPGLFSGDKGGFVIYGEAVEEKTEVEKAPTD